MLIPPIKIPSTIILIVCLTVCTTGYGQTMGSDNFLERAKNYMEQGNFEAANITFRRMLDQVDKLPPEMCYYFAETLYMLKQYENSKNFVEKYLELSDQGDNLYEEAVELQDLLTGKQKEIRACNYCNVFGYRLKTCNTCDGTGKVYDTCDYCKGKGIISCQLCDGKGVEITANRLGEHIYNTCSRCNGNGFHACPQCHGEKKIEGQCPVCLGSGEEASNVICDHTAPDTDHP